MASEGILVLGLDPGSRVTGWGLVREVSGRASLVDAGAIRCGSGELACRLARIFEELSVIIERHGPMEAALENVFVARNARSALTLGHARGAAMVACSRAGLDVHAYEPTLVKKSIVGVGRADKEQVAYMVNTLLGVKKAYPLDTTDALAVAVCHLNMRRMKRLAELA